MVPERATVYVCAIECENLRNQNRSEICHGIVMELESHSVLISFSSIQGASSTFGQVFVSGDPESQFLQH